ncbi:hypothetical protein [Micromonospora humida]|uniref:hypothetical protein n=1 Tax=Micromonospora humida TaxID=2809018 RepID=UPI0035583F32
MHDVVAHHIGGMVVQALATQAVAVPDPDAGAAGGRTCRRGRPVADARDGRHAGGGRRGTGDAERAGCPVRAGRCSRTRRCGRSEWWRRRTPVASGSPRR